MAPPVFLKKGFLSLYGTVSGFQYPRVYILGLLVLAILQIVLALTVQINRDEISAREFLTDTDKFLSRTIDDINEFIQESPNDVIKFTEFLVNTLNRETQAGINSVGSSSTGFFRSMANLFTGIAQELLNRVCNNPLSPSCSYSVPSVRTPAIPQVSIPTVTIPRLDLSILTIPALPFSAEREVGPMIDEVFGILKTVMGWVTFCVIAFLIWCCLPVLRGFLKPWFRGRSIVPGEGFCNNPVFVCLRTAAKTRVFIPILVGIGCLLAGLLLYFYVFQARQFVEIQLREADKKLVELWKLINKFSSEVAILIVAHLNDAKDTASFAVRNTLNSAVLDLTLETQDVLNEVTSFVSDQFTTYGLPPLNSPAATLPVVLLPSVPDIPRFDKFIQIPEDAIVLAELLEPVLDEIFQPAYDVAVGFMLIGVGLIIVPLLTILLTTSSIIILRALPTDWKVDVEVQQRALAKTNSKSLFARNLVDKYNDLELRNQEDSGFEARAVPHDDDNDVFAN